MSVKDGLSDKSKLHPEKQSPSESSIKGTSRPKFDDSKVKRTVRKSNS